MAKKKPGPPDSASRHKNKALGFRPQQDVRAKLEELASRGRRTLTAEIEIAIEERYAREVGGKKA